MLTGDHPATARSIGHALGLDDEAIVARATPAAKLRLVEDLQRSGAVVAVTGDGVNDAPALRQADVGVAMGRSGTEAAREAAAMVLTDDDFATIVAAVQEGRRIGDNIRKFVAFLLSANLGEVLLFAVAVITGLGAPLAVVQVLTVNIVTDALAVVGALVGGTTLAAFGLGHAFGGETSQTMAFVTLALSELALVFTLRSPDAHAWELPLNRWLAWSVAGSAALVVAAVYVPQLHGPLATVALGAAEAVVCGILALVPLAVVEAVKALRRPRRQSIAQARPFAAP
jgi:P-type Ca2+ transporter type 2C